MSRNDHRKDERGQRNRPPPMGVHSQRGGGGGVWTDLEQKHITQKQFIPDTRNFQVCFMKLVTMTTVPGNKSQVYLKSPICLKFRRQMLSCIRAKVLLFSSVKMQHLRRIVSFMSLKTAKHDGRPVSLHFLPAAVFCFLLRILMKNPNIYSG